MYRGAWERFWAWALDVGIDPDPGAITTADVNAYVDKLVGADLAPTSVDTAVIRVLFDTGCRLGELVNLHVADWDRRQDFLTLRSKTGTREHSVPDLLPTASGPLTIASPELNAPGTHSFLASRPRSIRNTGSNPSNAFAVPSTHARRTSLGWR